MKTVHDFVEGKLGAPFKKEGKLHKFWPVYDAIYTFLFVPKHPNKNSVHIRDAMDMKRTMSIVILAMLPALLFGMYNTGFQHYKALGELADVSFFDKFLYGALKVIPIIIVSYAVGLGIEFAFCIYKNHAISEGFLVSGILIPLVMPADVPLWMVAVSTAFAVLIGKEVFGGSGMNILNIALTARAFLFFAYPAEMSGTIWVSGWKDIQAAGIDAYSGETFLAQAISAGSSFVDVNNVAYASASEAWMQAFLGFIPGSIGETSALACLIGAAILILTGVGSWRIMLSVIMGSLFMGWVFNIFAGSFPDNAFLTLPFYFQPVIGSMMFGAVYMATDPVTASQTQTGKYIYGFLIGVIAVIIRIANPAYPEGVMLAILFMNVMAPIIDHYIVQGNIKRRLNRAKNLQYA